MSRSTWTAWALRGSRLVGPFVAALTSITCARSSPVASPTEGPQATQDRARTEAEAGPEPEGLKIPPPSGLASVPRVPNTETETLDNGLSVEVLEKHGVPLVQLSLLVKSGRASELDKTGVASLAANLIKFGGAGSYSGSALIDAFAAIGSELSIDVSSDWTLLSTVTTREHWQEALKLLGALVDKPRLPVATFQTLKQRAHENAKAMAMSEEAWAMRYVLYRALFTSPTGIHPLARFDASSAHLEQLTHADCRRWLSDHMTPDNSDVLVVGDVPASEVLERARSTFAGWRGKRVERLAASRPRGPERLEVSIIDKGDRPQADIVVGLLGAPRTSAAWPALSAATHLLGGSRASRLYLEVVENRHLAVRASARLQPFAGGMPALIEVSAATETERAEETIEAILQQLSALGRTPPSDQQLELSARALVDGFLMRLGTRQALTRVLAERSSLELGEGYFDEYREELLQLTPGEVTEVVAPYFDETRAVVVVAGNAKVLGPSLSRLGPVEVVDAAKDFTTQKSIPHDPTK